jgi:hypothetical protein
VRLAEIDTRLVLGAYVALWIVPWIVSVATGGFSGHVALSLAAALVFAGVVVALVLGQRWAWWLLVFFDSLGVLFSVVDFEGVGYVVLAAASLLLLLSPQIRDHVRPAAERRRDRPVNDDFIAR